MTLMGSNCLYGRPHGADPLPARMRPPDPDILPLHADIINGWPLIAVSGT